MGTGYYLKCVSCESVFDAKPVYKCPNCKGILRVEYNFNDFNFVTNSSANKLKQSLIFHDEKTSSLLGEGDTPTLELLKTANMLGLRKLFGKCEFSNPSGSFKDRPVAAGMKKAVEFGYNKVVVASSGNGAASVAAYSARLNLEAIILVPESTPAEKVRQSQFFGSKVIKVKGPYSNSYDLALKMSELGELYNLTTTFINPYTLEGDKGVAFEVHNQIKEWPDYIVVPIGAGPLLVGIYKGFQEMNEIFNLGRKLPKMIGVQASGCSPISKAYKENAEKVYAEINPQTVAGGIGDGLNGYSEDGTYTLDIIRESSGICVDVSDEEILQAQKELAMNEGLFVEPSSAAALAAVKQINISENLVNKSVLLLLTGNGLKDMKSISANDNYIPCIGPDVDELKKLLLEGLK
nr:threonine synthase [Fredinandcohnia onubensis]